MKHAITTLLLAAIICAAQAQKKSYVLVHGGWHGAWCWKKVIPLLKSRGHSVIAPDLPGHGESKVLASTVTFEDYVNTVVQAADSINGNVILVGHSMSGVVIAQAAERLGTSKVERLVFLDAFMPNNGESVRILADKARRHNAEKNIPQRGPTIGESLIMSPDKKTSTLKPENVGKLFYHDCSRSDISYAEKKVGAQPMICLTTPAQLTDAVYGAIPKVYILCTQAHDLDKVGISNNVPVEKNINLESSHSPFFSMPDKLAEILAGL